MLGIKINKNSKLELIREFIDSGYNHINIDESCIINLKDLNFDREKIFYSSQLIGENCHDNHKPENVYNECIKLLNLMGLDYLDLYTIHNTHSFNNINILDTYRELIKLKEAKKILNIGLGNITHEQLDAIIINSTKPDYIQIEVHPYLVEQRIVNFCMKNEIKIISYVPLGSSLFKDISNETILEELSLKYNKSIAQIILKWHTSRYIIPLISSNNSMYIKDNIQLNFYINNEDLESITKLNKDSRVFIKENHYESIGYLSLPPIKIKKQNIHNTENIIIQEIYKKGFYIGNVNDTALYNICINLEKEINNNNLITLKKIRPYEDIISNDNIEKYKAQLYTNIFINTIIDEYFRCTSNSPMIKHIHFNYYIKKSFPTKNLAQSMTGLYHRDIPQESLKILIYLTDVSKNNGPFKIVYPEIYESNLNIKWYNDSFNNRTSEEQMRKYYPEENILSVIGPKYTMIIFDGNIIHSGGYVIEKSRTVLLIELSTKL